MILARPMPSGLGAEVSGVIIGDPVPPDIQAELVKLFNQYGLLVFRDQPMSKPRLLNATHIFGVPDVHPLGNILDSSCPEVTVLSTHGTHGDVTPAADELVGKIDWHTDQAYVQIPNRGGVMYAVEIPAEGGMTGFIDMHAVYEGLSDALKSKIEGLSVVLSWRHAQETIANNPSFRTDEGAKVLEMDRFPDLVGPLVAAHPISGLKCLNTPPLWASSIPQLEEEESRSLLAELIAHVRRPEYAYWHSYRPGDVVVWDNWRMMHAASGTKGQYRRTMHRTVIKGDVPMNTLLAETKHKQRIVSAH